MSRKNSVSAVFPFFKLFCKFANNRAKLRTILIGICNIHEFLKICFPFKAFLENLQNIFLSLSLA